jgi:gas vesicle protein
MSKNLKPYKVVNLKNPVETLIFSRDKKKKVRNGNVIWLTEKEANCFKDNLELTEIKKAEPKKELLQEPLKVEPEKEVIEEPVIDEEYPDVVEGIPKQQPFITYKDEVLADERLKDLVKSVSEEVEEEVEEVKEDIEEKVEEVEEPKKEKKSSRGKKKDKKEKPKKK